MFDAVVSILAADGQTAWSIMTCADKMMMEF